LTIALQFQDDKQEYPVLPLCSMYEYVVSSLVFFLGQEKTFDGRFREEFFDAEVKHYSR
jgi:hypothetical protein